MYKSTLFLLYEQENKSFFYTNQHFMAWLSKNSYKKRLQSKNTYI